MIIYASSTFIRELMPLNRFGEYLKQDVALARVPTTDNRYNMCYLLRFAMQTKVSASIIFYIAFEGNKVILSDD